MPPAASTATLSPTQWESGTLTRYIQERLPLNDAQRAACFAPADQGLQVLAGAGTGKTTLITARTLYLLDPLLAQPHGEARVLVLTFTDKAAGEMRERIHHALRQAGYTGALPTTTIATFHTFCHQILQQQGQATGHRARWSLADDAQQAHLHDRLVAQLLDGHLETITTTLAESGLQALGVSPTVLSPKEMARWPYPDKKVVLQGFRTLVEQIKSYGLTPPDFLTLVRQQGQDWHTALAQLPQSDPRDNQPIATKEDLLAVWSRHLSRWADASWLAAAQEPNLDYKYYVDLLGDDLDSTFKIFDKQKGRGKNVAFQPAETVAAFVDRPRLAELENTLAEAVAAYYALYQQALSLEGHLDFNDLINEAVALLQEDTAVRERFQQWFVHVLVDEFQDTNGAQLALLRLLIKPSPVCNLTVVGDEKQSIYSFRYAQKENLDLVFDGYTAPTRIALPVNYRSVPAIVALANRVTQALTHDPAQQLEAFTSTTPDPDHPSVQILTLGRSLPPNPGKDKPGKESRGAIQAREDRLIVAEIVALLTRATDPLTPREIAVLLPSHRRADSLAPLLAAAGIPYLRSRDSGFFDEPTVKNATALLRILADPDDQHAWIRLLAIRLNQGQLWRLQQWITRRPSDIRGTWMERLTHLPDDVLDPSTATVLRHLASQCQQWHRQGLTSSPVALMQQALSQLDVLPPDLDPDQRAQEALTLRQFEALLGQLVKSLGPAASLLTLWQALREAMAQPRFKLDELVRNSNLEAVRLMTFHASKGLEYKAVFVSWTHDVSRRGQASAEDVLAFDPQMGGKAGFGLMVRRLDGATALSPAFYKAIWQKPRQLAEQHRLFYVAITRAKQRLYLFRQAGCKNTPWTLPDGFHQIPDVRHYEESNPDDCEHLDRQWLNTPLPVLRQSMTRLKQEANWASRANTLPSRPVWQLTRQLPRPDAKPLTLTFSKLEQVATCPTQYWWEQVAQVPVPATHQPVVQIQDALARIRGQVLHQAIEWQYRQPGQEARELLPALLKSAIEQADLPPETPTAGVLQQVFRLYDTFRQSAYGWEALQAQGIVIIAPELPIGWRTPMTVTVEGQAHPVQLSGKVDALFYRPDTERYTLVDFKTNARLTPALKRAYAQQLDLYREALLHNNPGMDLPTEEVRLVHLPDGEVKTYTLPELEHEPTRDWIARLLPELERVHRTSQPPEPGKQAPPCAHCPYVAAGCPHQKSPN